MSDSPRLTVNAFAASAVVDPDCVAQCPAVRNQRPLRSVPAQTFDAPIGWRTSR
jgi:hypothetical protein